MLRIIVGGTFYCYFYCLFVIGTCYSRWPRLLSFHDDRHFERNKKKCFLANVETERTHKQIVDTKNINKEGSFFVVFLWRRNYDCFAKWNVLAIVASPVVDEWILQWIVVHSHTNHHHDCWIITSDAVINFFFFVFSIMLFCCCRFL